MRLIKPIAAGVTVLLIICLALSPMFAYAGLSVENGLPEVVAGHPRWATSTPGMAWLDTLIIRDNANSFTTARLVPRAEYPYSHTYDQFVSEVDRYAKVHTLDENNVGQAYDEIVTLFYYTATAMGMTDDLPTMTDYLQNNGIILPQEITPQDTPSIAVVYAALRYNAVYALYEKEVTLPRGITLEAAEIIILSELTGVFLPSGVTTINGFAVQAVKTHVQEFPELPLSQNPSNAEVFHWSKVITAAAQSYKVPLTPYDEASNAQKEYVDYAYYATILNTAFDIQLNPARLSAADRSGQPNAVQELILHTMLDDQGVPYTPTETAEELFDKACAAGCFELDEEFFSDIFNYDLYVSGDCEKVWFTPISLADQLGGSNDNVLIYLNGAEMRSSATAAAPLNAGKSQEQIDVTVVYNDGSYVNADTVTYTFNVIKTGAAAAATTENGSNLLDQMQTLVNSNVSKETQAAQDMVNHVISAVEAQDDNTIFDLNSISSLDNSIVIEPIPTQEDLFDTETSDGEDSSGYFSQFIAETYAADEITVPPDNELNLDKPAVNDASLGNRAWTAIKENPEIAAAPTGIIALGGLAGYVWNKKRKEEQTHANEDNENDSFPDLSSSFDEEDLD